MTFLNDFDYDLPANAIAQVPVEPRDESKLLVIRLDQRPGAAGYTSHKPQQGCNSQAELGSANLGHSQFKHLGAWLPANSVLVFNNSKVIPCRLIGKKAGGGFFEAFILEDASECAAFGQIFSEPESLKNLGELTRLPLGLFKKCLVGKLKTDKILKLAAYFEKCCETLQAEEFVTAAAWTEFHQNLLTKSLYFGSGLYAIPFSLDLSDPFHPISSLYFFSNTLKPAQRSKEALQALLENLAYVPVPPYLQHPQPYRESDSPELKDQAEIFDRLDRTAYQSTIAKENGSVAAPTASLHFTENLLQNLAANGIQKLELTLHVGLGTFEPIKAEHIENHHMHRERIFISQQSQLGLFEAKKAGRSIIAIGSTGFRSLETWWRVRGQKQYAVWKNLAQNQSMLIEDFFYDTDLFIKPGDAVEFCDGLITNFHQPKSTLFVLMAALMGLKQVQHVYQTALEQNYRFLSYGDGMLVLWPRVSEEMDNIVFQKIKTSF